jgi:hypothetical protein
MEVLVAVRAPYEEQQAERDRLHEVEGRFEKRRAGA